MCRLLGLISNKPVDLTFSLELFKGLSEKNPDGWGIGFYDTNFQPKLYKEGMSAIDPESQLSRVSKEVVSHVIIAHVRKKGTDDAPATKVNSHPFKYNNWLFAHNGKIDREYLFRLLDNKYRFALEGKTDSEVYFFWILQHIEKSGNEIAAIRNALKEMKPRYHTGMNFLLTNGMTLYAFRYTGTDQEKYPLYWLKREPSKPEPIEFVFQETSAVMQSKSLQGEKAVLVCSEKLTRENWSEIPLGFLLEINQNLITKKINIY